MYWKYHKFHSCYALVKMPIFSTHSMKYIWYSLQKSKYPPYLAVIIIPCFQPNSTCKAGSAQKHKMHVVLERLHLQQFLSHKSLLKVPLKRKTDNISIIIWHMTTDKKARAVGIISNVVVVRQVCQFSQEYLQIPVSCWQMSQFMTNHTELVIFRSPGILDASIQQSGAYADGQHKPYVYQHLAVAYKQSGSLFCSNMPYDDGNVCFPFRWNIQQMILWDKNCCKCNLELHVHFTFLSTSGVVRGILLNNYNGILMLQCLRL